MKRGKKVMSLVLAILMLLSLLPASTAANRDDIGMPELTKEHEDALNSLLGQLGAEGISVWSVLGGEAVISPSGIDHRTRVSYEVVTRGHTNYEASQDAVIRFFLSNPNGLAVSFDYTLCFSSATEEHFLITADTVTFAAGETVKEVTIDVIELINNPTSGHPTASDSREFWNGERICYVFCSNIENALFAGDRQSLLVPVPIENSSGFDFTGAYQNASATYLVDLEQQLAALSTETPGRYLMEPGSPVIFRADIAAGDVRTMLDTGVFSHINMPRGYFLNESETTQQVQIRVEKNFAWGLSVPCYEKSITVDAGLQVGFDLGALAIEEMGLGRNMEGNGAVQSLGFIIEHFGEESMYVCFHDEADNFIKDQVSFSDATPPTVTIVSMPYADYYPGDVVPITVAFSEPVYTDNISIKINGALAYPTENRGTISETVSFLHELNSVDAATETIAVTVTDMAGARDLSGQEPQDVGESYCFSVSLPAFAGEASDVKQAFANVADTSVRIEQGESLNARGEITVSLQEHMGLNNWLALHVGDDRVLATVKAKVVGMHEGVVDVIDVPLYAETDGVCITALTGEFSVPANESDLDNCYVAEIHLDAAACGDFALVYGLSEEYVVPAIVLIDDVSDLEIVYRQWPPAGKIFADSGSSLSLGYQVNVNATWQRPGDFSWSSSDETIATITPSGVITLAGAAGTVTFTLTASNGGLANSFIIESRTLTVMEAKDSFLYVPLGIKNIEITSGNDAKVYYSTNITERNDSYGGSGTVTTYTFALYQAEYVGSQPQKGDLVFSDTRQATLVNNILSYTIPSHHLVNMAPQGKYSYILEVSAQDLQSGQLYLASANIGVKPLPAKAVLAVPECRFLLDDQLSFNVRFAVENKNDNSECLLTVTKNDTAEPVFATDSYHAIGQEHAIAIEPIDGSRLFDVYTVSLRAKNESDVAYSYDSYSVFVYDAGALKIMVNGIATSSLTMTPDRDLASMDSADLLNLQRKISYTDKVSINNKEYKWSNIADKISWEISDDGNISLLLNDGGIYRDISDYASSLFLPGAGFLLRGNAGGSSRLTATHALTGMTAALAVTFEPLEDKLFIFQTYPQHECELVYTNGNGEEKTAATDTWGRFAVYEESGIESDVVFYPLDSLTHDFAVISHNELLATQRSANDFGLYPQNNVKLPPQNYRVTLGLYEEETGAAYSEPVVIRGGVYRNGVYCPDAKINGNSGSADQTVNADASGSYVLSFNPEEFTGGQHWQKIGPQDELEYIIEISFPERSHYIKYVRITDDAIRKNRNSSFGVCLKKGISKLGSSLIQNNAIVISQTVTVDGVEYPLSRDFAFDQMPESIALHMELIIPGEHSSYYRVHFKDATGRDLGYWSNATVTQSYPFSNTITLRSTTEMRNILQSAVLQPGEKIRLYPCVKKSDGSKAITLSRPIKIQSLIGIPKMTNLQYGAIRDIYSDIVGVAESSASLNFVGGNKQIQQALDFLGDFSFSYYNSNIGLEIEPTGDPLFYKGVIRFAAGSYSRDNPSGVFAAGNESQNYNFMPGVSNIKAMAKGDYLRKSREAMNESKKGLAGYYKTYGGGAYLDCEVFYDMAAARWKIVVLKSDVYLGGGGGYHHTYNTWLGPIPVTAEFKTGMTAQIGLKTILDQTSGDSTYITELRPYFYIYGFGGAGFDYVVVTLKVGTYGLIEHEQRYLWYNHQDEKKNGQKLTISGSTGVEFAVSLLFISYNSKYEIASVSKSWTYNDFNEIDAVWKEELEKKFFWQGYDVDDGYVDLVLLPVGKTASFEDRSYLGKFERQWYAPKHRLFSAPAADDIVVLLSNSYPQANPVLSDDGKMMLYLSDMGSPDIQDTALCFTTRGADGAFVEGGEVSSSAYPDMSASVAGSGDKAVAVWTRLFGDLGAMAGREASFEDVSNMLASTEIMVGLYDDASGEFRTTRLTENSTPDMAPVVATNGEKTIVAWRSIYASDMEKPLDFDGRDNIMYSVFDGTSWSEAACLYDGSIDGVNALNAAMLADGTSAISWQISEKDTENTKIMCAVLDASGAVVNNLRLTSNDVKNENPEIAVAVFPDGVERFVIGWNSVNGLAQNVIRVAAVNGSGSEYSHFAREIEVSSGDRNFKFVKGAKNIEGMSIVWTEPDLSSPSASRPYKDTVWGMKFRREADGSIEESGKLQLLALPENNAVDFFDACVDPDTQEISFSLLVSQQSGESKLAIARTGYENNLVLAEPYFAYADILPGLDMPVLFRLYNEGVAPITGVTIELGGQAHQFREEAIKPGEYKDLTIFYTVPATIENPNYRVTAQFGLSDDTQSHSGTLRMDVPDVGIYQIDVTKEAARERGFRVLLGNNAYAKLKAGSHVVRLEVHDTPDFDRAPLLVKTISDADSLALLNTGLLSLDVTLGEENLRRLLDNDGEIRDPGAWLFFNVVTQASGVDIEDADIANDMDYVRVRSLLAKHGAPVSMASMMSTESGKTFVQAEAFNNSMNAISNGQITCILKDSNGKVLKTLQTYDAADASGSLLTIGGEESCTASFQFEQAGADVVVLFSRVGDEEEPVDPDPGGEEPGDEEPEEEEPSYEEPRVDDVVISPYTATVNIGGSTRTLPVGITDTGCATLNLGALAAEVFAGGNYSIITMPSIPGVSSFTLEMSATALSGASGKNSLTLVTDVGSIRIYPEMLLGMPNLDKKTAALTIKVGDKSALPGDAQVMLGDRPLVELGLSLDGVETEWNDPAAAVTVSIPYAPTASELANPESIVVWYVGSGGKPVAVPNGRYDSASGTVTFTTTHLGLFAVGYNKVNFNDVARTAWYHKAVSFIAARGITYGTGGGNYSPNAEVTRADCLVLLMKSFGLSPDSKAKDNFSDAGDTYYTGYLAAAKRLGITYGVGNNIFAPRQQISRQEMFTLLCNILRVVDRLPQGQSGKTLSDFIDAGQIAAWAKGPMKLLVETGIIGGDAGKLTPKSMTTRAEVAQLLYRLLSK